jgi:hypothetical protein
VDGVEGADSWAKSGMLGKRVERERKRIGFMDAGRMFARAGLSRRWDAGRSQMEKTGHAEGAWAVTDQSSGPGQSGGAFSHVPRMDRSIGGRMRAGGRWRSSSQVLRAISSAGGAGESVAPVARRVATHSWSGLWASSPWSQWCKAGEAARALAQRNWARRRRERRRRTRPFCKLMALMQVPRKTDWGAAGFRGSGTGTCVRPRCGLWRGRYLSGCSS